MGPLWSEKVKSRKKLDPQYDILKDFKRILLCSLILPVLVLGGCAISLPIFKETAPPPVQDQLSKEMALPPVQDQEETARAFPKFVAVVAQGGDTFSSLSAKYLKDSSWGSFLAEYNETEALSPGQSVIIPLKPGKRGGLILQGYQTVPVLCYHNLSPSKSNRMTVSLAMFGNKCVS